MKSKALDARLEGWAKEYAGSRYQNIGWPGQSWLVSAIKYLGRAPQGLRREIVVLGTAGDEVEEAVLALERMPEGFKPGRVLRVEYWMPNVPEELRLQLLRRIGLPMSRAGYYQHLNCAKFHVAAWLRIPIQEEIEERACV